MIRYSIDYENSFAVNIFNTDINDDIPFIYQPHDEYGINWDSAEAAENWAKQFIENYENSKNVVITEEDIVKNKLASVGLTVEDLKLALNLKDEN